MFLLEVNKEHRERRNHTFTFLTTLAQRLRREFSPEGVGESTKSREAALAVEEGGKCVLSSTDATSSYSASPTGTVSNLLTFLPVVAPFAVPALLYTITNNLGIIVQMEMDPATYQVRLWSLPLELGNPTIFLPSQWGFHLYKNLLC